MDIDSLKSIARQLRQPEGEYGIQVAKKMNESNLEINRHTIQALQVKKGDRILEIGMGNGFFVKDIVSKDATVVYEGCDFSSIMVSEAERLNKTWIKNGQVKFHVASAEKLPFDNSSFDKVFTVNTIYFWDDAGIVLSETRRVLKPGGQLIISVRPKSSMIHYPFVKYGFNMFSKQDLSAVLSKNKFRVETILEKQETEQEIDGSKVIVEALIVMAIK